MFTKLNNDSKRRLLLVGLTSILALTACGNDSSTATSSGGQGAYEITDDHAIGNPDARVTVTEYASVTCPACANFHQTSYVDFKKKYIDTGLVRFVFREFPTAPENIAQAGFLIANCAAEDRFFDALSLQFKRQAQIRQDPRGELEKIARSAGLSADDFEACLQSEEEIAKYKTKVQMGIDAGVSGTPSFQVNGVMTKRTPSGKQLYTIESWDEVLAPLLGDDAPAPEEAESAAE
ncbi:MAG: thioredoxin domain-containing protein [Maricaulaceae bacterium]